MWLYLDKEFRPPEAYAQWASSTILRDTYLTFALWTSIVSIALWALALIFSLAGATSSLATEQERAAQAQHSSLSQSVPREARKGPPPSIRYQVFH
jgi:hypothetical protein